MVKIKSIPDPKLKELPANILKLEALQELVLADNQLSLLPEEISECINLHI
ncbi:hypothetical protein [Vallitalea maricola]|uniref:Uncharacterized protein n=1 Tax=Vallitalea maricola TaxID=3074433 RepID=A0ACB5UMI1_9FIRM|nr:hypothetical protein AN2V17_30680 [Vallitalea sp. AN17-2]